MLHSDDPSSDEKGRTVQLWLNVQQRELLQRAVVAERLDSIEDLVRLAIAQTDSASAQEN
jgi:molybdopterin biosynthesis enzyme MoaB